MILTDREIEAAIAAKQIIIDPVPQLDAYSSTSLDLTLDPLIRVWKTETPHGVEQQVICPATPGLKIKELSDRLTVKITIGQEGYVIEPGAFLLAWTKERLHLPITSRLAARVEGKSSLARLGIGVHITAPTIHAGFDGQIQLEVCNHSKLRVKVMSDMRVCQLIFEQTYGMPNRGYEGQFRGQKGV